ncbi:MAG: phosphatidate cytidylyltransferase [Candidatus Nanopelagicales bacterium]
MSSPITNSSGRAGRNLPAATAVGVGLLALVSVTLFWLRPAFVLIAMAASVLAVRELSNALQRHDRRVVREVAYPAAALIPVISYLYSPEISLGVFAITVVVLAAVRLGRGFRGYFDDLAASVLVIAYVPLLVGFATAMSRGTSGAERVIVMVLLTAGNDTGGYAAGVIFGKHPIAAAISPKKSWEGLAGSLLAQGLLGALVVPMLLPVAPWQGIAMGLVMSITATIGDFAESAIKRDLGVKDMGRALPGHGGFMDRLDSLLVNALVAAAAFRLMGV